MDISRPLPKRLVVSDCAFYLDGGTIVLTCSGELGASHVIMLVQSMFPDGNTCGIPGRLYFDDELIPIRSELESQLLSLLRDAELRYVPRPGESDDATPLSPNHIILGDDIKEVLARDAEGNLKALLAKVIETVESPRYVMFASDVDRLAAAD